MRGIEPTLAGDYYGGFFTESDATGDIHKFTMGLAAALGDAGVALPSRRGRCDRTDGESSASRGDGER